MTYSKTERARAIAWKAATASLPDEARVPAPYLHRKAPAYDFCLPADFATMTLLPEVRTVAIELFKELGITWHGGTGPNNHLLSSQIQCINALGQMVHDPERIKLAFGERLGIAEVLEIEDGRYLTFEFIGPTDYFGEAGKDGVRTRGTQCTSVDAAFLVRCTDGKIELVLVEWKYTERYTKRNIDQRKDKIRAERYGTAWKAVDGPVRADLLEFTDLLDEPLYQLMRQQLLAYELEKARAYGADRVIVLHISPSANDAYQRSVHRPTQLALGSTVSEVWKQLLRHPDRFVPMDSAAFLDPAITSDEYVARYGEAKPA